MESEELAAPDKFVDDVPVLREIDGALQALLHGMGSRRIVPAVIQNQKVALIAGEEGPHLTEEGAAAHGAQPEGLGRGERGEGVIHQPPAELGDLDGVGHGAENGAVGAARHIAAQAYGDALLQIAAGGGDAGGQVGIGGGAVGHVDLPLPYPGDLIVIGEDAVGHDGGQFSPPNRPKES